MESVVAYLDQQAGRFEDDLCDLLRIASVSADSKFHGEVRRAADWVAGQFRSLGLKTELIETVGQPLVYAESPPVPGRPVVLVYGHYDVQPPDPLNEWITPPFEPTKRNGNVYARGATDDKGQMLTHVKSVEAWLKSVGQLPLQVKFLIEGEEEVGSHGLNEFLKTKEADRLACDVIVISDTSQFAPGQPAITYGLRGIAYYELRLTGPKQDLHSGTFGGGVMNPVNALCKMLAALVDDQGRIRIPGFYDDVVPLTDRERAAFAALPFDEQAFMQQLGVAGLAGEAGFTTLERRWARPTCDINGIWGGYQGEGAKTVIPSFAGAKLSFRLVPNQCPNAISKSLNEYLDRFLPAGTSMELVCVHGAEAVATTLSSRYVTAAARAIESGFGRTPVFIREGGSIPIVLAFSKRLNAEPLLLGWGLDDDNAHSPNEKFSLADYHRGIRSSVQLWYELAAVE